jgi:hypothetical protein
MGAIKEFGVNLVANVSGFKQSMEQAAKSSQKFKKDLDKTMKSSFQIVYANGIICGQFC